MTDEQRRRILAEWHRQESYLPRLWEALEASRDRRENPAQRQPEEARDEALSVA